MGNIPGRAWGVLARRTQSQHIMIKKSLFFIALLGGSVSAATVSSTQSFPILQNYTSTVGSTVVFDSSFLSASLASFNPALGTLDSFTITWTLAGNFSGTISAPGGSFSSAYNGFLTAAGHTLPANSPGSTNWTGGGGTGGGGQGGTPVNSPFTGTANPLSFTQTFAVSDAGVTYDQEVLTAMLGAGPVMLQWVTPLTITGNLDTLAVSGAGSVELSFDYTVVPEVSSSLLGLGGMLPLLVRRRR